MAGQRRIGMLIFPRMTQLDMTGPYEVLARLPNTAVELVARTLDPVKTDRGMRIVPTVTYAGCPPLDVVMVPGGPGQQDLMEDAAALDFLRKQAASAKYVTSVCTGSLVLAAAGLLKGKRATCHWAAVEHLKLLGAIPVREKVVVDGNIVTGAGVTSGIDFALTLAAILEGEQVAREIQLQIEYDPDAAVQFRLAEDGGARDPRSGEGASRQAERGAAGVAARVGKPLEFSAMAVPTTLDHCVIHVSDWERSNKFYTRGDGRRTGGAAGGLCLSLRRQAAQRPWAGRQAGGSGAAAGAAGQFRSVFRMARADSKTRSPISKAHGVAIHRGPLQRFGAKGPGTIRLFPRSGRLADGIHVYSSGDEQMTEAPGTHNPNVLPPNIPAPQDDGAARHLAGMKLPDIALPATAGAAVNLAKLKGRTVVYIYPRTGVPGRTCRPAGTRSRARAAARRNPAVSAIISASSSGWAWRSFTACPRRTPPTSRRRRTACICRFRSCRTTSSPSPARSTCRPSVSTA